MQSTPSNKIFNSLSLKIFAIVFMIVDHIGYAFFPDVTILRMIGRMAFPLFCFLFAYGISKLQDKPKEKQRMAMTKTIIKLLFLAIITQPLFMKFTGSSQLNIIFLFLLISIMWDIKIRLGVYALGYSVLWMPIACLISSLANIEYGIYGTLMLCFMMLTANKCQEPNYWKKYIMIQVGLWLMFYSTPALLGNANAIIQISSVISVIFVLNFNGSQGNKKLYSAMFWAYPIQFGILYLLQQYIHLLNQ